MFGFLPGNLFTHHMGQSSSGLSPRLWARITGAMMSGDGTKRLFLVGDDFGTVVSLNSYVETHSDLYYTSYITDDGTIKGLSDEKGGAVQILSGTTDEDENWIQSGDATSVLGAISDTAGDDHVTAFECRIKKGSLEDDEVTPYCGLCEVGQAAAATKGATNGKMADLSFIGFDNTEVAGETCNFVYHKNGDTDNGGTIVAAVHTFVADEYVKLGFLYDPAAKPSKRIRIFVDNVEAASAVSASDIASTTTGVLFPDAVKMSALFGHQIGSGSATGELVVDWWAFAQLIS